MKMRTKTLNKRLSIVIHVAIILALILLVLNLKSILIHITGSNVPVAVVNGRSMFPTLREGDIVFSYRPKPQDIRINDIIIYRRSDGTYIIHRVISIHVINTSGVTKYYYETKGDNNPVKDPGYVPYENVEGVVVKLGGKVLRVPYLGYLSIWYSSLRRSIAQLFIDNPLYNLLYPFTRRP